MWIEVQKTAKAKGDIAIDSTERFKKELTVREEDNKQQAE